MLENEKRKTISPYRILRAVVAHLGRDTTIAAALVQVLLFIIGMQHDKDAKIIGLHMRESSMILEKTDIPSSANMQPAAHISTEGPYFFASDNSFRRIKQRNERKTTTTAAAFFSPHRPTIIRVLNKKRKLATSPSMYNACFTSVPQRYDVATEPFARPVVRCETEIGQLYFPQSIDQQIRR